DLRRQLLHRTLATNVHGARRARAAGYAAEPCRLLHLVGEYVAGPHSRAAFGERQADGAAEPVGGAGNDHRLAAELDVHVPLRTWWRPAPPAYRVTAGGSRARCRAPAQPAAP